MNNAILELPDCYDVVVVGGGNAGLCAALTAHEAGRSVLLLEKAPPDKRGGNSVFTGGRMRIPHGDLADMAALLKCDVDELSDVELDPYTVEDLHGDLLRVSRYQCDEELAELIAKEARPGVEWLQTQGCRFELARGEDDVPQGETVRFMGGDDIRHYEGGIGLVDSLVKQAERVGIDVRYRMSATALVTEDGAVCGVVVRGERGEQTVRAKAVVLACGGFEANAAMRATYLGPGWDMAKVRGTEFNTGDGLTMALEIGARPHGNWSGCHSVAFDYLAPPFGDRVLGDVAERVSYRAGITVDRRGKRFFDEGADLRAFTYAVSGRNIIELTDGYAVQIVDAKGDPYLRSQYRTPNATKKVADSLDEIADALDIDVKGLQKTIDDYNRAAVDGPVDFSGLDGRSTTGINPPKSNWAARIDQPPYTGYAVGAGITFTFGGLRVTTRGEVVDEYEQPIPGLFAAGEIVGGIYCFNYAGGSGLVSGIVMARRAGSYAATCVGD